MSEGIFQPIVAALWSENPPLIKAKLDKLKQMLSTTVENNTVKYWFGHNTGSPSFEKIVCYSDIWYIWLL